MCGSGPKRSIFNDLLKNMTLDSWIQNQLNYQENLSNIDI